ncbi:MAG: hypothetical protein MJE68_11190 [Proteobacteria bacterium]|nr:hypothetical protein [Pseudomonadota bacterium]
MDKNLNEGREGEGKEHEAPMPMLHAKIEMEEVEHDLIVWCMYTHTGEAMIDNKKTDCSQSFIQWEGGPREREREREREHSMIIIIEMTHYDWYVTL